MLLLLLLLLLMLGQPRCKPLSLVGSKQAPSCLLRRPLVHRCVHVQLGNGMLRIGCGELGMGVLQGRLIRGCLSSSSNWCRGQGSGGLGGGIVQVKQTSRPAVDAGRTSADVWWSLC